MLYFCHSPKFGPTRAILIGGYAIIEDADLLIVSCDPDLLTATSVAGNVVLVVDISERLSGWF